MINRRQALVVLASQAFGWSKNVWDGFDSFPFPETGKGKTVYRIGSGPPVLFLHELPGLMPEAFEFARRLKDRGYTVYVPLLFGKAGESSTLRVIFRTPCWGSEFNCISGDSIGSIVSWIAALTAKIDDDHGKHGLAVIGNCLTGSVPLALMASDTVRPRLRCVVLSQPAIPMGLFGAPLLEGAKVAFGLSAAEIKEAVDSNVPALALRFCDDPIVPKQRMEALISLFANRPFEFYPVNPDTHCDNPPVHHSYHHHAVLTIGYCDDQDSNGRKAFEHVVAFLQSNLKTT